MNKMLALTAVVVAVALNGCAHTVGKCEGNSVCPIIIYEKFPNVFATFPDHMSIKSDSANKNYPTLIWTFADQTKYTFLAKTNNLNGDGIEVVGKIPDELGMSPCYITADSKSDLGFALGGPYYRCQVVDNASFTSQRYRVRFHDTHGNERMVDPTIDSTGGGDIRGAAAVGGVSSSPNVTASGIRRGAVGIASYGSVTVNVGDDVTVPPIGSYDGIKVVWDAGPNGLFKRDDGAYVRFKDQMNTPVSIQPCFISKDADGSEVSNSSRYYFCLVTTTSSFNLKYDARYRDAMGINDVKDKKFVRP